MKVQSSKKTGSGQEDVYEPSLWYYILMLFITDQDIVLKGVSSIENMEIPEFTDEITNVSLITH